MKKWWLVLTVVMLLGFSVLMAQEIHWANQITVAWDAPEFLIDGTPIPTGDTIVYNMYLRINGSSSVPDPVGTTSELEYTYTLDEGVYEAGVSAVRYIGGAGEPFESDIIWSKDADPPFLLGYGLPPRAPEGFNVQ